jgi:hypothetical protein
MEEINKLKTTNDILINGIKNIVDPISYLKSQLGEGERLNVKRVTRLLKNPLFYQQIAKDTLKQIEKYESNPM